MPPAAIGILGSGQLGRMLAIAARQLGYRVHVYSPDRDSPTGQLADREVSAPYDDLDAVRDFARRVAVVTYEFENVPAATAAAAAEFAPVRPGFALLHTAQDRIREKGTLAAAGLPVTPFRPVRDADELALALAALGTPAVLKTARSGYDGKGQVRIDDPGDAARAWQALDGQPAVLEQWIAHTAEFSVIAARGADGSFVAYPPLLNEHHNHILDVSQAPAPLPAAARAQAVAVTQAICALFDVVGLLCIEFFLGPDGAIMVNEIAPRPHNSGHLTLEAAETSQFEQQLRAVCGLPLGRGELRSPAAMVNLLGDLWQDGTPDWPAALGLPGVHLHLYGKAEARAGRKMGHLTVLGATAGEARARALAARAALARGANNV